PRPSPRSQTPVWERAVFETPFRAVRQERNGVSKTGVPKQEFGNEEVWGAPATGTSPMQKTQIRIVAGRFRGRKLNVAVHPGLREGQLLRTDVYRWAERWRPPEGPVNVFVSPPFADLAQRPADFHRLIESVQAKAAAGSVLTVQVEDTFDPAGLPDAGRWEAR